MARIKVMFTLLAIVLLSTVLGLVEAAPWPQTSKFGTHQERVVGKGLRVVAFHPESQFTIFGANGDAIPTTASNGSSLVEPSLQESAMAYLFGKGFTENGVIWRSGYTRGDTGVAYLRQSHNGILFANAVCNIAMRGGKVASWGSSLIDLSQAKIASSEPSFTYRDVLLLIEYQLDAQKNEQEPTLEYFAKDDGSVALTHVIQVQNKLKGAWYEVFVDAHTGEIVSLTDFVSHAQYTVLPATKKEFTEGLETLTDPQDLEASPLGWHTLEEGGPAQTTTSGNNVISFQGTTPAEQRAAGQVFNATYDGSQEPQTRNNVEASVTNAFYIINTMHDVTYRYGFTEDAFNFQENNLGNGGREGDRVEISVQDASGINNAAFGTPPDGQSGQCVMFIWTLTEPNRDGAMENDIIIHEFTHGVTNRMTGGGTARCLQTLQSAGLGEGWGDAMANWMAQTSNATQDFAMGTYVTDDPSGIRSAPYSTDPQTNPLRFSSLNALEEVHQIGEVWANILHNVYAALVEELGFNEDKLTDPEGTEGNVVFMHLFIDALTLQPCNPTFIQARDAWIQADENRYEGRNKCTVFKAFASRGLGAGATGGEFVDDTTVPADCR